MVAIKGIIIDCLDDGPTLEKGGYIFYSGFKYGSSKTVNSSNNNQNSNANNFVSTKRIKVNQFFFVRISRHDDPCIGELVSIWKDKYRDTMLASVRLYFLPEQTPDGRQSYHGQHEVLAASEPVILRLNDLVSWITEEVDWVTGLEVPYHASHIDPPAFTLPFLNLINDVKKIPIGHANSINPHQSNHHHDDHHSHQHKSNDIGSKNIDTIIEDKLSKKQFAGDQQQSTSSSSEVTLTSSSSSSSSHINNNNNNNNSLMRVIDSQIGNQSVIVVLSYPQYCRYRAVHKKMEENMKEKENIATSINCQSNCHPNSNNINCNDNDTKASPPPPSAAAAAPFDESTEKKETLSVSPSSSSSSPLLVSPCFRVLFCRETFEHEGLLHHDLNCEHLAPKLKGRPRKRGANHHHNSAANNKATSSSATATATTSSHSSSSAQDSDTSEENSKQDSSRVRLPRKSSANTKVKSSSVEVDCAFQGTINTNKHKSKPPAMSLKLAEKCLKNESEFMKQLNKFMKERNTPITRIPHLGFKKIDLFYLFTFTQKLGGYEKITQNKEWKKVYDELGGDPRSTSAATCTRRHFERLLLPFENHLAEARGLVVTRRSTRGRSISPILPAGSPVTRGSSSAAAGFDDDYQSIGSVNSTERRSHRRSHRQGVRQSKRLKGVNSSSGGVSASSTVGGSNASSTATDDDECYSPMSNEDDNNNNKEEETVGDEITSKSVELKERSSRSSAKERSRKLSGGEEETHSVSSLSSKSREDDNGTLNKSKDNQSDSLTEEDEDNDHQDEEGEGDDTGDGGSRRKRKRRKGGKSCKALKCKSRSPSVENNLNSSNVKKSQSERKFVVKIDGLSTGDPKIRNEGEIMSEGGEMATSQRSVTSTVNLLVPKSEPIETALPTKTTTQDNSDSITKEKHLSNNEYLSSSLSKPETAKTENESEDDSMIRPGTVNAYLKMLNKSLTESDIDQCIPVSGSKLPVKSEVKPFNTKESVNCDDNETSNNNDNTNIEGNDLKLPVSETTPCNKNNNNTDKTNGTNLTTGTNHCDNVNSSLSKSDSVAKITINPNEDIDSHGSGTKTGGNNNIIDSPLSSISTLISAMDAAKQKQIKLDPTKAVTNNDNHQLSSSAPTVGQTNINIVQSNVTLTSGSFGFVKKSHHVKNNANATIFQNINPRSGSSTSLSPSSGRPSVIQKTPLKPCVKVVPTYKDNPIEGLLKDNSLLKKTQLPPIAHAASFLSSSPTWFSSNSSVTPPGVSTLVNSKNNNSNRNSSSSSSSLKRKLGPSVNENSPDTFPLDLTNKKRPCDLDPRQIKSLTSKGKIPALIKLVGEGEDGTCPPAAILDLSSKIRVKEILSSKTCSSGNNTKIDNNNNNSSHRPLSFHHQQQHQDANSDVNLVPVPKVPKSNINDRMKSNSSKSGNNHQQPPPPPSSRQLVNQSPLSISSPVPSGLVGILPPSSTPSSLSTSSSSSSSTPAAVVVAPTPKYHSSTSTSTNKHHHQQQQAPQQNVSNSNRSQLVKPSPSPNALKERKESKVNHLSPVIHPGFAIKDLNQQQQQQLLFQTHLNDVVNSISDQQHHSHHQRRQQYQSQQPSSSHHQQQQQQPQPQLQQLPLQLPAIPFPDNRDIQSKLQSANTLNQLRAMVTPDFALAQQTIAQEIALREMERLNPNLAKQMSQMSSAAAAAAMLGYPTGFHPMLNMPTHRSTVPTSSPSISEYNPTLPSFLPFFNSFIPPGSATGPPGAPTHSTGNGGSGGGGVSTPNSNGNMVSANASNNVNSAVAAAAAAALASGHFFNPAALAAASQGTPFSPLELLGAGLVPGNERFAAAVAADDAARWRGWFESRTFE